MGQKMTNNGVPVACSERNRAAKLPSVKSVVAAIRHPVGQRMHTVLVDPSVKSDVDIGT